MKITTIGLDLAKNVFQIHGVDEYGKVRVRRTLRRAQVLPYFSNLPACRIGMEACASGYHWGRELGRLGHEVKLMAAQFVKPYVKGNKNDAADAEAICEAVSRVNMRFVAVKNVEQQAVLALHRARDSFVKAHTAQSNQIRGLLGEFGLVLPKGHAALRANMPGILADADNALSIPMRELLQRLMSHLHYLQRQCEEIEQSIVRWHRSNEASRRLAEIPGIGPLTASALVASIGDIQAFKNARQLAAWLGLVPAHDGSGGRNVLLGISKRGDGYVRRLLIHGARSVLQGRQRRGTRGGDWLSGLLQRRPFNVAVVALANKNARRVWALLSRGEHFRLNATVLAGIS